MRQNTKRSCSNLNATTICIYDTFPRFFYIYLVWSGHIFSNEGKRLWLSLYFLDGFHVYNHDLLQFYTLYIAFPKYILILRSGYFMHKFNVERTTRSWLKLRHTTIMLYDEDALMTWYHILISLAFPSSQWRSSTLYNHLHAPLTRKTTYYPWKGLRSSKSRQRLPNAS